MTVEELERLIERCGGFCATARRLQCSEPSLRRYRRGRKPSRRVLANIDALIAEYGVEGPIPKVPRATSAVRAIRRRKTDACSSVSHD